MQYFKKLGAEDSSLAYAFLTELNKIAELYAGERLKSHHNYAVNQVKKYKKSFGVI